MGVQKRYCPSGVDAAVTQGVDIIIVSDFKTAYRQIVEASGNVEKRLTGFGKEIHRLEWTHGYRFNPTSKMMVPPNRADGLSPITKLDDL